jgi:hypothetical protein
MAKKSLDEIKLKIEKLLKTNQAQLSLGVYYILKMDQTPKDSILEYINHPDVKLSKVEQILKNICPHCQYKRSGDSKSCSDCNERMDGWWCDKSPDNSCYYFSEEKDGKHVVGLENGSQFILPADHDPEEESEDCCLFCGEPEERK